MIADTSLVDLDYNMTSLLNCGFEVASGKE